MARGKNTFKEAHFHNEKAARAWFEAARWPHGPVCPHCGSLKHYATKKAGRYRCGEKECRKDYTVMTKSVMERSHAPLTSWATAFHLYASSKKGFTATQLERHLGCEYNTAWFIHHRVMEAMRRGGLDLPPMGGPGSPVEVDETYFGNLPESKRRTKTTSGRPFLKKGRAANKRAIVALVDRSTGNVRSFHVPTADAAAVAKIVRENVHHESRLHTDESKLYITLGKEFAAHETVNHGAKEYARGDVTTNTVEGYFGIFKRGMRGNYQHCAEKNLHRYLAEFDFRYNTRTLTDGERAALAVRGGEGKRLTYRQPR
ncbi:MAG: IS1595 family transposase ISNwi1 [Pseudorhodoplanes sp.]|nr:IS1595 family transposase ISNwi1 [Pseudorhodoplanes sp.]